MPTKTSERLTSGTSVTTPPPPDQSDRLNIQVLYIQRILFDELAPRCQILAHQGGEDGFAFGNVFELDGEQCAALRIHGGFPQLRRSHFAQAFVALDGEVFAAGVEHIVEQVASARFLDEFNFALALGSGFVCLFSALLLPVLFGTVTLPVYYPLPA